MPRIRSIKPEITSDRKFATVSRDARLVFVYTLTIADDDGLFRAETRQLLGDLFPFEPDVSPETLRRLYGELTQIGVIRWRQTVDGSLVGEIVNWAKHQQIKNRSKPFLAMQLVADSVDPTEALRRISPDPTETLGVRSLESGVLSQEPRVRSTSFPRSRKKPRAAEPEPTWVQDLTDRWLQAIGSVTHARLGKALKPVVDVFGLEAVVAAMDVYASSDEGPRNGIRRVEFFANDFAQWHRIATTPLVDPVTREPTERGKRVGAA